MYAYSASFTHRKARDITDDSEWRSNVKTPVSVSVSVPCSDIKQKQKQKQKQKVENQHYSLPSHWSLFPDPRVFDFAKMETEDYWKTVMSMTTTTTK